MPIILRPQKYHKAIMEEKEGGKIVKLYSNKNFTISPKNYVITCLTQKKVPFEWDDKCKKSFLKVKTRLTSTPVLTFPIVGKGFYFILWCLKFRFMCWVNAGYKCDCLYFETAKALREEIPHTWLGTTNYGVCFKNIEALSLWGEMWVVHRLPQLTSCFHPKEIEFEIEMMDGVD